MYAYYLKASFDSKLDNILEDSTFSCNGSVGLGFVDTRGSPQATSEIGQI